jgi:hypothetical protein
MRKFGVPKMSGLAHTSASKLQKCPDADTYILVGFQGSYKKLLDIRLEKYLVVSRDEYFSSCPAQAGICWGLRLNIGKDPEIVTYNP